MKHLSVNPITMKSKNEPKFYFSAYPLKALNLPEENKKSCLHIYHDKNGHINRAGRSKVLPMINPYKESIVIHDGAKARMQAAKKNNKHDNIQERDSEWFASYE